MNDLVSVSNGKVVVTSKQSAEDIENKLLKQFGIMK